MQPEQAERLAELVEHAFELEGAEWGDGGSEENKLGSYSSAPSA
jgi:hypothetical protein